MNIFSVLKTYEIRWQPVASRQLNEAELSQVIEAITVCSTYGISVKFTLKTGGMSFIPLSEDSTVGEGVVLDLTKVELITLKKGDDLIYRIKA